MHQQAESYSRVATWDEYAAAWTAHTIALLAEARAKREVGQFFLSHSEQVWSRIVRGIIR